MPTVDRVVAGYVKLRDEKLAIQKRQKEELAPYNEKMGKLEAWLMKTLNDQNAESIRTNHGTVFKMTRTSSKVEDWEAALDFIRTHDLWHLLEKRVSKVAVAEMAEEGQTVPGVTLSRDVVAQVRRT